MKHLFSIAITALLLSACSGSDNGNNSQADPTLGAATEFDLAPYTEQASTADFLAMQVPASETSTLVATEDFEFKSSSNKGLTVDMAEMRGQMSYLSICPDYTKNANDNGYDVDYNNCLLKTRMTDGYYELTIDIPNQYSQLLAVAWPLEAGNTPAYSVLPVN